MKYRFADILIDTSSHCVMRRAQVLRLTNIEFRLLEYLAVILGVIAFSSFWSILELFQQEKRVQRGWFPKNPKRK